MVFTTGKEWKSLGLLITKGERLCNAFREKKNRNASDLPYTSEINIITCPCINEWKNETQSCYLVGSDKPRSFKSILPSSFVNRLTKGQT